MRIPRPSTTRLRRAGSDAVGAGLLVAATTVGGVLSDALPVALPGSVVGLVLLAAALVWRPALLGVVARPAQALLGVLGSLFVPVAVEVRDHAALLATAWPALAAGVLLSMPAALWATAAAHRRLGRAGDER